MTQPPRRTGTSSLSGSGELMQSLPLHPVTAAARRSYHTRRYGHRDDETSVDSIDLDSNNPLSLDGYLYFRMSRSTGNGSLLSRKRFVSLSFANGGSIKVFKDFPGAHNIMLESHPSSSMLHSVYSKLHRGLADAISIRRMDGLEMYIPDSLPWIAKDVENDTSSFAIEIPSSEANLDHLDMLTDRGDSWGGDRECCSIIEADEPHDESSLADDFDDEESGMSASSDVASGRHRQTAVSSVLSVLSEEKEEFVSHLQRALRLANQKGKPFRMYFRCCKGSHEKALWLKAFSKLNRLSKEYRIRKSLFATLTAPLQIQNTKILPQPRGRTRRESVVGLAQEVRDLDLSGNGHDAKSVDEGINLTNDMEALIRGRKSHFLRDREYRVLPSYAYPYRWMTRSELKEEMILPSEHFHDLRVPGCKQKEIGSLRVEVLQCVSLPKLDRTSDTDAVAYLVCGSYAFATDVIPNRANPIWLRKSRRACDFPLFHGYARLYVGVFDNTGNREKDDFAGRVVIDLARLRPHSIYDVTLPLRLSTHVYTRRKRGAIRLRFTVRWQSERDALLSYLPRSLKIPLPQNSKPNFDVTVNCADQKAFRNIAITVHGAHLPGRFTFHQMRASIRELNFTRRYIFQAILQGYRDLRHWQNPAISAFVFLAWMHSIYANAFSLVPAYTVLCFLLFLIRNYAKYAIEGPQSAGFIPPSWEEMFMCLVRGGDPDYRAIETLELGHRPAARSRRFDTLASATGVIGQRDYRALTHKPQGLPIFKALGFMKSDLAEYDASEAAHLEFPFADADGVGYPKFGVKECLVVRKGDNENQQSNGIGAGGDGERGYSELMSRFPIDIAQFPLDMHLQDVLRKDSSGLKEYDEEENNFTAGRAVVASGMMAAKKVRKKGLQAATTLTEAATKTGMKVSLNLKTAATELTEMTGLNHVVTPIRTEISKTSAMVSSHVVNPIRTEISKTSARVSSGVNHMMAPIHFPQKPGIIRRRHTDNETADGRVYPRQEMSFRSHHSDDGKMPLSPSRYANSLEDLSILSFPSGPGSDMSPEMVDVSPSQTGSALGSPRDGDPVSNWPEQNIDIEGPKTEKKLTDDLDDIKDKMHELLWHLFDDHAYVIKNPDAVYFGEAKKPEKRRKEVKKQLDKLLHVGQYSHSNPFVARVGLYVEPIIGSVYAFLSLFRTGFNALTWQDPMLTFWISFFCGLLAFILFFFPWRQFLFVFGFWLVGPQNWIIRILRAHGHLPPLKKPPLVDKSVIDASEDFLERQPVFATNQTQNKAQDYDKREVHSVVVPYSPLMYQRFYDWPPEPIYAQVKPDTLDEARRQRALTSLQRVATRSTGGSFVENSQQLLRNRFPRTRGVSVRRRRTNTQELPWQKNTKSS